MDTHLSIPFNLHFVDSPRFIGKPSDQVVFFYLWDMYIDQIYTKTSPQLLFSLSKLSEQRNINRRAIKESLNHLFRIGLITENSGRYAMCADRFIELSRVFSSLNSKEDIQSFISAVNNGDDMQLKTFGYNPEALHDNVVNCIKSHNRFQPALCEGIQSDNIAVTPITQGHNNIFGKVDPNLIEAHVASSEALLDDDDFGRDDEEGFEEDNDDDFTPNSFKLEPIALVNRPFNPNANYKIEPFDASRKKKNLAYIPKDVAKRVIEYLPDAVERFDYLFIWNLYQIIEQNFGERDALNDEDEGYHTEKASVEKVEIPAERYVRDYIIDAYNDTMNMIRAGKVSYDGEEIPIGFTDYPVSEDGKNPPIDVFCIVDFVHIESEGSEGYLSVSQDHLRDIYSPVAPAPATTRSLSDKELRDRWERDEKFFAKLLWLKKEGAEDRLTDVESAAASFLFKYYQISDDYRIVDLNEEFQGSGYYNMNRNRLLRWLLGETNITRDDFISILVKEDTNDYGSVEMREMMFSVDKIMRWNKIHNQVSVIMEMS